MSTAPALEENRTSAGTDDEKGVVDVEEQQVEYRDSTTVGTERREAERRLVRKLDKRILPLLCAMYLFACKQPDSHTSIETSLTLNA